MVNSYEGGMWKIPKISIKLSLLLQIIFRFALALFKCKEEEFLKLQDPMAIFKYLRYFTRTILDARWIIFTSIVYF